MLYHSCVVSIQVVDFVLIKCFESFNPSPHHAQPHLPTPLPSVLDPHEPSLAALVVLCKADKRYSKHVSSSAVFRLDTRYHSTRLPPELSAMPAHLQTHPSYIEKYGVAGAAIENHTLLGRILRIAPSVFEPQFRTLLGQSHKSTKPVLDGHFNTIRGKIRAATACAIEVVMSMLRQGGDSKTSALLWLTQAVALNAEAAKDRPSPLLSSSAGFLLNLNTVLLKLCEPMLTDIEKLRKVQPGYLSLDECRQVFPADETPLTSPTEFSTVLSPSSTSEQSPMSFITQSFFLCWRGLHVGYAQQCTQYYQTLRALGHYQDGLSTDEPRSIHYLLQKLATVRLSYSLLVYITPL